MNEIQTLKAENERLNKIISVLLLQLDAKNEENTIADLRDGAPQSFSTIANLWEGIPRLQPTIAYLVEGSLSVKNSFADLWEGTLSHENINPQLGEDSLSLQRTIAQLCDGIKQFQRTFSQLCDGIKQAQESFPQKNQAIPIAPLRMPKITPLKIEITDPHAKMMKQHVKKHFRSVISRKTIQAIGKQFLLMHNNQFASHDELRKISGLSTPGFAKHLPNLRKKGLVKKLSFKKYALTDVSKQILNEVFGREAVTVG